MPQLKHAKYRDRLLDGYIDLLLTVFGAVQIDGMKYCGKTWTARAHALSEIRLDNSESRAFALADPSIALKGETPRLIDEWQEVPSIRDDVRRAIDESGNSPGHYLLTGSSVPPRNSYTHSGAGRIARVHMRTLSLAEAGASDSRISLKNLFDGKPLEAFTVDTTLDTLAALIVSGGWPAALDRPVGSASLIAQQYLVSLFEDSAPRMGKTPDMARRAFMSLARNNGTAATLDTIASDMASGSHNDPSTKPARSTVEAYLDFFRDTYLLEELGGWDVPVRSKKRLRIKPKRYIADPSLAVTMLGMDETSLLNDFQTFGGMFESMCLRDLLVYTSADSAYEGSELRYYHDETGLEVDVVIQLRDGRWGCVEFKLSEDKVPEGVTRLLALRDKLTANKAMRVSEPSFLAVLVGRTSYARTTPEGVHVIPVTSLGA